MLRPIHPRTININLTTNYHQQAHSSSNIRRYNTWHSACIHPHHVGAVEHVQTRGDIDGGIQVLCQRALIGSSIQYTRVIWSHLCIWWQELVIYLNLTRCMYACTYDMYAQYIWCLNKWATRFNTRVIQYKYRCTMTPDLLKVYFRRVSQ